MARRHSNLPLLTLNNTAQDWRKVHASLLNGHLDLGAFRYQLKQRDNSFVLYNALIPELIAQEKAAADAAEQARLAAEAQAAADAAEQARLAAEAKAAADAAEQARLAAEAKAAADAAEQARLAAEAKAAADAAEQARLAAEAQAAADAAEQARLAAEAQAAADAATETQAQPETKQNDWISQNANTALSSQAASINLLTKQQNLLSQYISRLNVENSGLWANIDREGMRYTGDDYRTYKQELYSQQLGADKATAFDGGNWLFGAAFTHSKGQNTFSENQNGKSTNHAFSLYNKVIFDNQAYLSAVLSYNHLKTTLNRSELALKQNAWIASFGLGKRWEFGSIGVQPSLEISYYRLNGVDYSLNQTPIHGKALDFWQTRSGIMLDKTFGFEQGNGVKLYTALYYVANINNKAELYADGNALRADLFKNRMESELGAIFGLGRHVNITLKGGYGHGDVIKSQFNGGVELKYSW
ncbi:autotransporter outer membrane beta-barrel domain-containing protein [Testudinibacter sp. P80/BLE/0925]|uniref:autotransporter outer membrane beta-barrel domain-containing protein n=1 Tax=Testudinibacter sp. TW-1 TaxID=3417757 RepID=UPI003D3645F7